MKHKRKIIISTPLILIAILLTSISCMKFRTSNKKTLKQFEKLNQTAYINKIGKLRVIKSDTSLSKPAIIFIHVPLDQPMLSMNTFKTLY